MTADTRRILDQRRERWVALLTLLTIGCGNVQADQRPDRFSPQPEQATQPRCDVTKPFGRPTKVTVTANESLVHVFHSDRAGTRDLYIATRPSWASAFGPPFRVANVNTTTADESSPYLAGNGLYFSSNRNGDWDLYRASRVAGAYAAPSVMFELGTAGNEGSPVVAPDELTIFFARDSEIYVARRSRADLDFGVPEPVRELNTAALELPVAISADGCTLQFMSNGRAGALDLFAATRPL